MGDTADRITAETLQEIARVTDAQVTAAHAGDLASLQELLAARRDLLDSLRGHRVGGEALMAVAARDREARGLLEARQAQVQAELVQLRHGGRALSGYTARLGMATGLVDQIR
jgi:hypothetical protein